MSGRRIGVYVCQCGGNISDHVDVERVREAVGEEDDVVVARTAMFTCSDATQQEICNDIKEYGLDGLVVASCSPKLHTVTFRRRRESRWPQPLLLHPGEPPRAVLLGAHR